MPENSPITEILKRQYKEYLISELEQEVIEAACVVTDAYLTDDNASAELNATMRVLCTKVRKLREVQNA